MMTEFETKVEKMRRYCQMVDRCHREVRTKLLKDKIYGEELEQIMAILVEENFLNEERYARAYARGKFRQNQWGKNKIRMELKSRDISDYCIRKGLSEIDDEEYDEVVKKLADKKIAQIRESNSYKKKQKVINYLIGKGYEYEVVKEVVG